MTPDVLSSQNILHTTGNFDRAAEVTELRLEDGRTFRLPTAMLSQAGTGDAGTETAVLAESRLTGGDTDSDRIVIPIAEEHLTVGKRLVPTGTVRLHKTVQEFETAIDEPLAVRTFDIERVILNQPVDAAPGVRQDGDTTVYPIVEEQLILTKQLVLREEVRITRRDTERIDTQTVTLRREQIDVERTSS